MNPAPQKRLWLPFIEYLVGASVTEIVQRELDQRVEENKSHTFGIRVLFVFQKEIICVVCCSSTALDDMVL